MLEKEQAVVAALLLISLMAVAPAYAFVNVETGVHDTLFEAFGPRIDRIFIKMYAGMNSEVQALKNGEIDVTDWHLDKASYDYLADNPNVTRVHYSPPPSEKSYFTIALNENNSTTLGPDLPDPNPKYPNPMADVNLRRAIAYLINRTYLECDVTENFSVPMYTAIVPYMKDWLHTEIRPGGILENLTYPFNVTKANEILNNSGYPIDPTTSWRFPDRNRNGLKDPGETWDDNDELDFYARSDRWRKMSCEYLCENLRSLAYVPVALHYVTMTQAYEIIQLQKDFHAYTGGWIFIGPEPDYLFDLYHSSMYWHEPYLPPPNYYCVNDSILDPYLEGIKFGTVIHGSDFNWPIYPDPITKYVNSSCWKAQERICEMVHHYMLFATFGVKGLSKTYTDLGKPYTGKKWHNIANEQGFGINTFWTFLNAYPEGYVYGDGANPMVMQYGWKEQTFPTHLNILYADWYWDFEVLNKIYDTLAVRNPYDLEHFLPWMVNYYEQGTYDFKGRNCSKVLINLKTGIKWHDGTPVTINDVAFSLVEVNKLLLEREYSPSFWYGFVSPIVSYTMVDPLTVELLLDTQSAWALQWCLIVPPIIPEHIWRTIVTTGAPNAFQPDPTMTGSGPFKYLGMVSGESLEMEANKDYFRYLPIMPEFNTTTTFTSSRQDPNYPNTWTLVTVDFIARNLWLNETGRGFLTVDVYIYKDSVLSFSDSDVMIQAGGYWEHVETFNLTKCSHEIKLAIFTKGPAEVQEGVANPWIGKWANATVPLWVTIKYDIAGGLYLGKVVAPDCKVEGKDNAFVAAAYNTVPGDGRWKANADVTGDYKVEGKDVAWIAKYYGKW